MVIPFFRKGSDALPASKPADLPAARFDFYADDARVPASGKIHVDEVSDAEDPAVEEAAILFANGSDAAALAVLCETIDGSGVGNETLWIMLFDLCRLTRRRDLFEQYGLAYARQFSRSPPAWSELGAATKLLVREVMPSISLEGTLDERAGAEFEQIGKVALKAGRLKIDLARLRGADAAGCAKLVVLLQGLRQARVAVRLANARNLLPMLEGHLRRGHREGQAVWLVTFELLQALAEQERFEALALDYAITFEESPPSYEAPVQRAPAVALIDGTLGLAQPANATANYVFEGELTSARAEPIRMLTKYGAERGRIEIDALRLRRMDFVSAGNLFNVLVAFRSQGKPCVIRGLNGMVAALLRVMGVHRVAQMELRRG